MHTDTNVVTLDMSISSISLSAEMAGKRGPKCMLLSLLKSLGRPGRVGLSLRQKSHSVWEAVLKVQPYLFRLGSSICR